MRTLGGKKKRLRSLGSKKKRTLGGKKKRLLPEWQTNPEKYLESLLARATEEELCALSNISSRGNALDPHKGHNFITWRAVEARIQREIHGKKEARRKKEEEG